MVNGVHLSVVFPLSPTQSCPVLRSTQSLGLLSCPPVPLSIPFNRYPHGPLLCPALPVRHGSFPKESQRGLSFPGMESAQHWVMGGLGRAVYVKRRKTMASQDGEALRNQRSQAV